jgi:hypothetical protein
VSYRVEYQRAEGGLVAYVSGDIAPFSFRVGAGEIEGSEARGSFLWVVKGGGDRHCLELVLFRLPDHFLTSGEPPEEILASHMRWAASQAEGLGRKVLDDRMSLGSFPTGEPILAWCMEGEPPRPPEGDGDRPTAITAHATTLHAGHVLAFVAWGPGEGWDRKRLETKCLRAALSVFRHD